MIFPHSLRLLLLLEDMKLIFLENVSGKETIVCSNYLDDGLYTEKLC